MQKNNDESSNYHEFRANFLDCKICHTITDALYHLPNLSKVGIAIECIKCHYVIFKDNINSKVLFDNFLLDKYCIVRDFIFNRTLIFLDDKNIATINYLINIPDNINDLLPKIQTILTFS